MSAPAGVTLRRSPRARQLRLVVKPQGIELVIPDGIGETQALAFFQRHRAWAERKLAEIRERAARIEPDAPLARGGAVPFQGQATPLIVTPSALSRRLQILRRDDGAFEITLPAGYSGSAEQQVRAALFAWIRRWLEGEARRLASWHGEEPGLLPRAIRIKRMNTRWGSCGPANDISLNWVLAFAPPAVLEYVIVHELCHIRHRNHSEAYWMLVSELLPDWPRRRAWLKQHGVALLRRFA